MTPGARVQAAIEALDKIAAGAAAEQVLTAWARGARYAGSKDRAAVRDYVYDALRRWRSSAALGGADTGRGRMIGLLRDQGADIETLFTGQGHAPPVLTNSEREVPQRPTGAVARDLPDWVSEAFDASLGDKAQATALALRKRAPVFLRVNLRRGDRAAVAQVLLQDGIETQPHGSVATALKVVSGERKILQSEAFSSGLVELQDAHSQAIVADLPFVEGGCVLDYCAGGGGKALALADRGWARIDAHDVNAARMRDLPHRAARARVEIALTDAPVGPYDMVFCDAPCSGSGSWRRDPQGKWQLTRERLRELCALQAQVLDDAASLVGSHGRLAYATCSVLKDENSDAVRQFLARSGAWSLCFEKQYAPGEDGDGFYVAVLMRDGC